MGILLMNDNTGSYTYVPTHRVWLQQTGYQRKLVVHTNDSTFVLPVSFTDWNAGISKFTIGANLTIKGEEMTVTDCRVISIENDSSCFYYEVWVNGSEVLIEMEL